ncbi:MAG: hypothetical protein CUN53_03230 [Phototrophicales bacterium]|nr:MAG: hypothetical protein CUN53_03230 [Phototrophicales bacterium]
MPGYGYRLVVPDQTENLLPANAPKSSYLLCGPLPLNPAQRFVGREREQLQIKRLIHENTRLISIYGGAGSGKTALLCKVIEDILHEPATSRPTEIVCLSAHNTSLSLPDAACELNKALDQRSRLDISLPTDSLVYEIASAFHERACLLLLDGLEAVQDETTGEIIDDGLRMLVENVITTGVRLRIIVTSRDPLSFMSRSLKTWERSVSLFEGLSVEQGSALLRLCDPDGVAGLRDAPNPVLQTISRAARGNPRVLENIAGLLLNDPSMTPSVLIANPDSLAKQIARVLVHDAMSRLSPSVRRVLQVASVIERPFTKEQFSRVADGLLTPEQIEQGLARLTRGSHLLFDRDTRQYRLREDDRPYIYETLPSETDNPFSPQALYQRVAQYSQE